MAVLVDGDRVLGPAALIDESGLFVAAGAAVPTNGITAKVGDKVFKMVVLSREKNTELVLLRATDFPGGRRPLRSPGSSNPGAVFAVLSGGPIRAEYLPTQRFAVLETRRGVPIAELRFEAPPSQFGTGLVVSESGEFYGSVKAALSPKTYNGSNALNGVQRTIPDLKFNNQQIGPAQLMVAYTVGPEVIRRVLDGFLSPSHEVVFPSMGVFCTDAIGGGALIQSVTPGSPAERGGLIAGDILLDIGGQTIGNQLDFARVMLGQEPGKRITLRIKRGSASALLDVVIGRAEK